MINEDFTFIRKKILENRKIIFIFAYRKFDN